MEKCLKCDKSVTSQKDGITCNVCSGLFHLACVGVRSASNNRKFKCEGCAKETSSVCSQGSLSERDSSVGVLEAIAAFRKEFEERGDRTILKLDQMQSDINNVVAEMSALKAQYLEIKVQCDGTSKTVEHLESENARLSKEVDTLQREVSDLQQHTRKNNIIISGVPRTPSENVYMILEQIARVLDIRFDRYDISVAHRLAFGNDRRPPSIIVNFVSRSVKGEWLRSRRTKGDLTARELHPTFPEDRVYLNEHLTVQTREIFNAARTLKKANKLAGVWTNDGHVMVKKSVNSPPFRIRDLRHLRGLNMDE